MTQETKQQHSVVTDDMVRAGSDALSEYWNLLATPGADLSVIPALVIKVYEAMDAMRISPKSLPKLHQNR